MWCVSKVLWGVGGVVVVTFKFYNFETGEVHSMNFTEGVSSLARVWEW